jgi:sterol desaturase/sphingolipid hydroxylase (fatty acid hydroxylase superfamily)
MDLTVLAIPVFLAAIALEAWVARRQGRVVSDWRDSLASLAAGTGSVAIGAFWKGALFACYFALYEATPLRLGNGPLVWLAALLADDFAYYWFHRLHHEVRFFWAAHVTHHSSQRYNLSTALRQSWTPMTSLPFYAALPLLGFDPAMLVTVHAANLLYQFWIHTETIGRLGSLEAVLNTPSHHRVHHASNAQYLDRNYAGILIVWDRLFGTFEPEVEAPVYGLTRNLASYNPLRIAFHEWAAIARDVARPNPLAVRLGLAFRPPGWRPGAVARSAPELRARREAACGPAAAPGEALAAAA